MPSSKRKLYTEARKAKGRTQGEAEADADAILADRTLGKSRQPRGGADPKDVHTLNTTDPDPANHFWERA